MRESFKVANERRGVSSELLQTRSAPKSCEGILISFDFSFITISSTGTALSFSGREMDKALPGYWLEWRFPDRYRGISHLFSERTSLPDNKVEISPFVSVTGYKSSQKKPRLYEC